MSGSKYCGKANAGPESAAVSASVDTCLCRIVRRDQELRVDVPAPSQVASVSSSGVWSVMSGRVGRSLGGGGLTLF